jgi:5-formyltetrahydrofolate cyclo-ligase
MSTDQAKQAIRERIWSLLEREHAVPELGVQGRIPNFNGADTAAEQLATLPEWNAARVIKAVPDRAQLRVRQKALEEGKLVYMAVPRLADKFPFYELDPATLTVPPAEAASKEVAAKVAPKLLVEVMKPVDMAICGSVAVDRKGVRLGKGAGYSDIELALLQEAGLLRPETLIVTTVHALQVVDGELPESAHDFRVDVIVTPEGIIRCPSHPRPRGIVWEHLDEEKIAAIPVLAAQRPD